MENLIEKLLEESPLAGLDLIDNESLEKEIDKLVEERKEKDKKLIKLLEEVEQETEETNNLIKEARKIVREIDTVTDTNNTPEELEYIKRLNQTFDSYIRAIQIRRILLR